MNGIIHNCSHPPSTEGDMHFRITEEQMILAVYAYIDHLFTKIKPRKVFFMAIDGCAPRAKMNQQRSRRFRTAKENKEAQEKAERSGEVLPEEKAFDSNCITPGKALVSSSHKSIPSNVLSFDSFRYPIYGPSLETSRILYQQEDLGRLRLAGCQGYL
jgi:5'-3' exonuclease